MGKEIVDKRLVFVVIGLFIRVNVLPNMDGGINEVRKGGMEKK
jgi:hypothetical protein